MARHCAGKPNQNAFSTDATGRLAKTDRQDAAMLARMGRLLDSIVPAPMSAALE